MLGVGQQSGSRSVVGLGRQRRTCGKGVLIKHIQRQQGPQAVHVLRFQQPGKHPARVGRQKRPVMLGSGTAQAPGPAQTVKAKHGHNVGVIRVVSLREDGVVFDREEFPIQKALSVMVPLPRKRVEQNVRGSLLNVFPVGGVPQAREGPGLSLWPE